MISSEHIDYFRKEFPALSDEDVEAVLGIARLKVGDKGELLIREGEVRKEIIFVLQGIIRAYYINDSGWEMTPFFWAERQITASWEAVYMDQASSLNYEMIEQGAVIILDSVEFKKLVAQRSNLMRVYLDMMESILTETLIHSQSMRNEKPEDRYRYLLTTSPDLAERLSQKHIASYLGITEVSFSRMKKRSFSK